MSSSDNLKIPYEEIVSITDNFADGKVIGEGGLSKVYKATRSQSGELANVVVRRVDHSSWMQDTAYHKEIKMLSRLKHKNMVSLVGFCNDNNEMLVVYKDEAHGNLEKYLDDPKKLTWLRRLKISVGVASALSCMHEDNVIHHNVNCSTILIDENWEAKLSGFELSMRIPAEGDQDPAYEMIGIGTYKSDAYSFGIVLFEILCGSKAFVSKDQDNTFQTSLVIFHYEDRTLHKLVDPDLFNQMDKLSFNILSATAYDCLKKQQPPNMKYVLERLKKALELQEKYENNEHSSTVVRIGPSSDRLKFKLKHLEHMRIQLKDIKLATKNFSRELCIMSGGFGMVYRTKLKHVDRKYCKAIEGENEQVSMRHTCSEVAVKNIFVEDESGEQGFYAEIDMLTSCKHSNIVTLFGFCNEGSAMILVYEYASKGSLANYITGKIDTTKDSWVQRMNICLQVAMGLSYLHTSEGDRKQIVHRDIKSANILLDENFDAKIGDFGLCKYLSENEDYDSLYPREIAGTKVYMDPQYAKEGKLRKELDIYSLGVVMFEMLCGKVAYHQDFISRNNLGLAPIARQHFLKGTVEEIVDIRMKEGNMEQRFISIERLSTIKVFSLIAFQCLAEAQAYRPTLEYVIKELKEALPFQVLFDKATKLTGNKIPKKESNSPRN